jgi:hypothetical protein
MVAGGLLGNCDVADVSEVLTAFIVRAIASETSVKNYETAVHNIPEDSQLHTRRHENLNVKCFICYVTVRRRSKM